MKLLIAAIGFGVVLSVTAPASGGDVKLQVANGRVLVQANNATLREILAEWARVGNVKFVNLEQVASAPMTIDVQWQPESQVLTMLLRSLSGFAAAPKLQAASDSSIFDRVVIMAAPRPAATASASYTQPQQPQPIFRPGMQVVTDDQDAQGNMGGLPPGYQPPPPRGPGQAPAPTATPTPSVPQGVPGTMSPMPTVPGTVPTGAPGTVSPLPGTQGGTGRQGGPGGVPSRPGGFNNR